MAKEYIEREALLKQLRRNPLFEKAERDKGMFYIERSCIDAMPTLTLDDIIPHGRWEEYPDSAHLRCTHCKIEFKKEKMPDTKNHCPHCAAKMDLEGNDDL